MLFHWLHTIFPGAESEIQTQAEQIAFEQEGYSDLSGFTYCPPMW